MTMYWFESAEFNVSFGAWPVEVDANQLGAHLGSQLTFVMSIMRLARLGTKVKPSGDYT